MASIVPETATRLKATAFVNGAELGALGRGGIIRAAATEMAESALRKLLEDCITTSEYMGHQGQTLTLDVYVLAPADLHQIIMQARAEGERDAMRWTTRTSEQTWVSDFQQTGGQPTGGPWKHAANEWADTACNALQWLRNIQEGISTPDIAVADVKAQIKRCRETQPPMGEDAAK